MKKLTNSSSGNAQKTQGSLALAPDVARSRAVLKLEKYKMLTDGNLYDLSKIDMHREISDVERVIQLLGFDSQKPWELQGKRFLDAPCGSYRCVPYEMQRYRLEHDFHVPMKEKIRPNYLPWLSRYLSVVAKADVIGIDLERQHNGEPFKSSSMDLRFKNLSFLPSGTFDGIACMWFVELDNPFAPGRAPGFFDSVDSASSYGAKQLVEVCNGLLSEFHRLLKVGGRLVNELHVFEKQAGAGELVRIE